MPACTVGWVELPVRPSKTVWGAPKAPPGERRATRICSRPGCSAKAISPSPVSETATASEFPLANSGAGTASVTGPHAPPGSRTAAWISCSASLPTSSRSTLKATMPVPLGRAAAARAVDGVRRQRGDPRQAGRTDLLHRRSAVGALQQLPGRPGRARAVGE